MHQSSHIPDIDRKGLRHFGLIFGVIVSVLFGLALPWLFDGELPRWPWVVLGVCAVWAFAAPGTLRPVYVAWMKFGLFMSRITTPLLMGLVFYLVLTPTALLGRLMGRDILKRRWNPDAKSYRATSEKAPVENLKRPF